MPTTEERIVAELTQARDSAKREAARFQAALNALRTKKGHGKPKPRRKGQLDQQLGDVLRTEPDRAWLARELAERVSADPGLVARHLEAMNVSKGAARRTTPPEQRKYRRYRYRPVSVVPGEAVSSS